LVSSAEYSARLAIEVNDVKGTRVTAIGVLVNLVGYA
jgi:hypothetical protein